MEPIAKLSFVEIAEVSVHLPQPYLSQSSEYGHEEQQPPQPFLFFLKVKTEASTTRTAITEITIKSTADTVLKPHVRQRFVRYSQEETAYQINDE